LGTKLLAIYRPSGCTVAYGVLGVVVGVCNRSQMFNFWCEYRSWPWLESTHKRNFWYVKVQAHTRHMISPTISAWLLVIQKCSECCVFSLFGSQWFGVFDSYWVVNYVTFGSEHRKLVGNPHYLFVIYGASARCRHGNQCFE